MPQTRVHPWHVPEAPHARVYLKREDQGQFAITAGKLRKYASLIPHLQILGVRQAVVIGSENSNHVVGICQLLLERNIMPIPFLKKGHSEGTNQMLLQLMIPKAQWIRIEHADWPQVEKNAVTWAAAQTRAGNPTSVIPEGACMPASMVGATTLAADIQRNESTLGFQFSDIYIDAGTGLSAAALVMALQDLHMQARVHVTLMADSEEVFLEKVVVFGQWYAQLFEQSQRNWCNQMILHRPILGASYGSVNGKVIDMIKRYAARGILTDPIYSAKHIATAEHTIAQSIDTSRVSLIIHSGGAQALPGYGHLWREE